MIIYIFNYLQNAIGKLREEGKKDKIKLGCLSYPDLIVSQRLIDNHFHSLTDQKLKTRDDSKRIKEWHGIKSDEEIIETDYFDFIKSRVFEAVVDLNYPIPEIYHDKHDPVIDTGTLEQCLNVSTAFMNMYKLATTDNGVILTDAPMNKMNHIFWNFSPCLYTEFIEQNNSLLLYLGAFYKENGAIKEAKTPKESRRFISPV